MTRSPDDLIERGETSELGIFVPAIMSAGLVFSLVALVQDLVQRRRWTARHRRVLLAVDGVIGTLAGGRTDVRGWLRSRWAYVAIALGSGAAAVLLGVGATANYLRPGGYVRGIAWLWALSMLISAVLGVGAVAAGALAWRGNRPPVWTLGILSRTPLSRRPPGAAPAPAANRHAIGAGWAAAMLGLLAVVVAWLPSVVAGSDQRFANALADRHLYGVIDGVAELGSPQVVLLVAVVAVIAGYRCLLFSVGYVGAVAGTYLAGFLLTAAVQRAQPLGVRLTGMTTFPWVPVAQAVLIAGLLPFALRIWRAPRWSVRTATAVLALGAAAVAVDAVHDRDAWPTDILGGLLLGLSVVFVARAVLARSSWHRPCPGCPWSPAPAGRGVLHLSDEWARGLHRGAVTWTLILAGTFAALSLMVGVPQAPEGFMVPSAVTEPLQVGLVVLMLVGGLLAFRWIPVGAVIVALAGIALAVLSAAEYPPATAVLITAAVLAPGFALWLAWQHDAPARRIWAVSLITTVVLCTAFAGAARVYAEQFGPTHPESALPLLPVDRVEWAWAGAVTPTGATVVARTDYGVEHARLELRKEDDEAVHSRPTEVPDSRIVRLDARGLEPGTRYAWRVVADGRPDRERGHGTFRTPIDGPVSFTAVVGACARTGSNGSVYDAMRAEDPDLVVFTGDLFYENIGSDDVDAFRDAYDRVLTQPAPAALLRAAPALYLWDDHDYGPNDADRSSPSRPAARAAYRESVPHTSLGPTGPASQAFTVGRVRFVVTDERSQRTERSMLGERQMRWFLAELEQASRDHALVVWVNSVPWIGTARPGADGWAGYPADRRRIADAIANTRIDNLVMLAGDAHMVAIDDGTNSDYSTAGGGGFPILHAAPLDRPGSIKGGPYSEGAVDGSGQYGVLRVEDDGTTVAVELTGHRYDRETLMTYRFTVPRP